MTAFQEALSQYTLYRILLNSFQLLFPADVPISLNLRNLAKKLFSSHDPTLTIPFSTTRYHKRTRLGYAERAAQWHSIVAGAAAGDIVISLENPSRQKVIAQPLFVRQVPLLYDLSYSYCKTQEQ